MPHLPLTSVSVGGNGSGEVKKIEIRYDSDESFDIYVDDMYIRSANHDELGWAGMDALKGAFERLAEAKDIEFLITEGFGDND